MVRSIIAIHALILCFTLLPSGCNTIAPNPQPDVQLEKDLQQRAEKNLKNYPSPVVYIPISDYAAQLHQVLPNGYADMIMFLLTNSLLLPGTTGLIGMNTDDPMFTPLYDSLVGVEAGFDIFMTVDLPRGKREGRVAGNDRYMAWHYGRP